MDAQKDAPCGADPASPPGVVGGVTVYEAGETITLTIDEFVGHTGSLRVAIDPTGTDAFALPASYDDLSGPNILASFDDASGAIEHQLEVTLPSEPCDPCTLQVIQIMEDGNFSADDFYFQCADIVIEAAGGGTDGSDSRPTRARARAQAMMVPTTVPAPQARAAATVQATTDRPMVRTTAPTMRPTMVAAAEAGARRRTSTRAPATTTRADAAAARRPGRQPSRGPWASSGSCSCDVALDHTPVHSGTVLHSCSRTSRAFASPKKNPRTRAASSTLANR
jgi:hypothetical protein